MDRRLQERVESVMAAEPREPGASTELCIALTQARAPARAASRPPPPPAGGGGWSLALAHAAPFTRAPFPSSTASSCFWSTGAASTTRRW